MSNTEMAKRPPQFRTSFQTLKMRVLPQLRLRKRRSRRKQRTHTKDTRTLERLVKVKVQFQMFFQISRRTLTPSFQHHFRQESHIPGTGKRKENKQRRRRGRKKHKKDNERKSKRNLNLRKSRFIDGKRKL